MIRGFLIKEPCELPLMYVIHVIYMLCLAWNPFMRVRFIKKK